MGAICIRVCVCLCVLACAFTCTEWLQSTLHSCFKKRHIHKGISFSTSFSHYLINDTCVKSLIRLKKGKIKLSQQTKLESSQSLLWSSKKTGSPTAEKTHFKVGSLGQLGTREVDIY